MKFKLFININYSYKYIIKNYESLFKSDDKVSNHMNFINDDDFEVLKY